MRKNNYNEKRKKKLVQKIELGYCPDYIVRRENCITIQVLYCDWECKARGQFVLQYNILYCDLEAAGC